MRQLFISNRTTEKVAMLYENNRLMEVYFDRDISRSQVDDIYLGKVVRIEQGLQAAFVNIGMQNNGFLRQQDVKTGTGRIESLLTEGQYIYVQVKKDGVGNKGPVLTTDITIPGAYIIYLPLRAQISVSNKISKEEQIKWKQSVTEWLDDGEGAIIRTSAQYKDDEVIKGELEALKKRWKESAGAPVKKSPGVILTSKLVPDHLLRKYPVHLIDEYVVDDVDLSKQLQSRYPAYKNRITWKKFWHKESRHSIQGVQEQMIHSVVEVGQGISLTIEETEALVVIDVNSQGFTGRSNKQHTAYQVNLAAVKEIARQIRLRNLSGIIVIDFINTDSQDLEGKIKKALSNELKEDPISSRCHGFTALGLFELTRKRELPSWRSKLIEETTTCKNLATKVFELERELLAYEDSSHETVLLTVSPVVADLKKQLLSASVSSRIPQEVFFRIDPAINDYRIEMAGSDEMVKAYVASRGYHVDKSF
ncbi:ribonuclease G [Thalassobacillus cyri]|uniref:Ribonuclease G n=1 Tax=Thalassobacillus cyri TaxID=571932 RepID=A0A1H4FB11_9BACI|nr:ribonuclease E/G [Thalassobacillus cyri]SEA94371.1 ribonuclease G [Thalassobacillus cyri]